MLYKVSVLAVYSVNECLLECLCTLKQRSVINSVVKAYDLYF